MGSGKAGLAALTMVHEEDFFLERWVKHWRRHIPAKHIYIINHGDSPAVSRIARECTIIRLPYDQTKKSVNQRRWQILSLHASALTSYFDWVICNDVDEIVLLDPKIKQSLPEYLAKIAEREHVPPAITPFAIEMVHVPEIEADALTPEDPILGKRRCYRLNSNYAKPCILGRPMEFKAGGHGGNHKEIYVDPHLYNFHLRFIDFEYSMSRFAKSLERRLAGKTEEEVKSMKKGGWAWVSVEKTFRSLSKQLPIKETIDHPDFRRKMLEERILRPPFTLMGGGRPKGNYRLPERFNGII
ncbi:MAG: glycosyltransferase family 2 protein [Pseudomonadota bacterium]